jgi:murein DD-endopeptidase MepM/ murein hydrolase activator NlpD
MNRMEQKYFLVLAAMLGVAKLHVSAQTLVPTEALRRGEAGFAFLFSARTEPLPQDSSLVIVFADGRASPRHAGSPVSDSREGLGRATESASLAEGTRIPAAVMFMVGVPVDAALGEARMLVSRLDGQPVASAVFKVVDRAFPRENVWLNSALSGLRVDPDPRKTEQALRYRALLASSNPVGVHLESGFARPVETDRQTSLFGTTRRYLYADGGVDTTTHWGIDYGCPVGTPVLAAASGRVVMAEYRIVTGNTIVVEHLPGVFTIYMHMDSMAAGPGAVVKRGDPIGTVGATGLATGPHLHWELRVAQVACDPEALVGLDKIPPVRTILPAIEGR